MKHTIEDAIKDLNNQLDVFYEGKRFVKSHQVSKSNYILVYYIKSTLSNKPDADYQFAQGNDLKAMRGYIMALANIINLGGRLGIDRVEGLLCNSKQYILG
jgi:hypothetical protein